MDDLTKKYYAELSTLSGLQNAGYLSEGEYEYYKKNIKQLIFENAEKYAVNPKDYSTFDDDCLSEEEIEDLSDKLFELDDKNEAVGEISKLNRADLYHFLDCYNWDDGFEIPEIILANKNCDLALALSLFYSVDGYTFIEERYFENKLNDDPDDKWSIFCQQLFDNIGGGKYKIDDEYQDLAMAYKIVLVKKGVINELTKDVVDLVNNYKKN